ncbi:hypothetical protein HMPREF1508_0319 [Shuttleworthella sp. MSX8B]|nr:hypothetical protein HMPREF1508_0319 [Shuttleworthia sp. MSX8B]
MCFSFRWGSQGFFRDFHGKIFGKIFTPGAGTMIQAQYRGCNSNAVPGP